jgi:hypothetical protein
MHVRPLILSTFLVALAIACTTTTKEDASRTSSPIINGQLDTTHSAVVAVYAKKGEFASRFTGTIVHGDATTKIGYVLTAAHTVQDPPVLVMMGEDYTKPDVTFEVLDYVVHPNYSKQAGSSYDFAVVRIVGVDVTTPMIATLAPAQDNLAIGTSVVSVGYGRLTPNDGSRDVNTTRRKVAKSLSSVGATQIRFSQTTSGICEGDSGGPVLVTVGGQERVAGVHSYVTGRCIDEGLSGRVSIVDSWLAQQYAAAPPKEGCDVCSKRALSGTGECAKRSHACDADPECSAYSACLRDCKATGCEALCASQHPLGVGPFKAVGSCPCTEACSAECASSSSCKTAPKCGVRYPGGSCTTCIDDACCAEEVACGADGECYQCISTSDTSPACMANAKRMALAACAEAKCTSPCPKESAHPADSGCSASGARGVTGSLAGLSLMAASAAMIARRRRRS